MLFSGRKSIWTILSIFEESVNIVRRAIHDVCQQREREREHAVQNGPMLQLQQLQHSIQNLVKNERSDSSKISITKKRENTHELTSHASSGQVLRRMGSKIISRGKLIPSGVVPNDITACLSKQCLSISVLQRWSG